MIHSVSFNVKQILDFFDTLCIIIYMVGEEVRKRRKALELNQSELAELLGVTRNTVARWERDEVTIPSQMLELALKQLEAEQKKKK